MCGTLVAPCCCNFWWCGHFETMFFCDLWTRGDDDQPWNFGEGDVPRHDKATDGLHVENARGYGRIAPIFAGNPVGGVVLNFDLNIVCGRTSFEWTVGVPWIVPWIWILDDLSPFINHFSIIPCSIVSLNSKPEPQWQWMLVLDICLGWQCEFNVRQ